MFNSRVSETGGRIYYALSKTTNERRGEAGGEKRERDVSAQEVVCVRCACMFHFGLSVWGCYICMDQSKSKSNRRLERDLERGIRMQ
jgi:hypothetical protein